MLNNFMSNIKSMAQSPIIAEQTAAMKNEILRKCGVGVCEVLNSRLLSFLPDNLKLRLILATPTGKKIMTIVAAQFIGNTLYAFKDKLSPENQKYLDMIRQSAWMASATAMVEMANLDYVFDMLFPANVKDMLRKNMGEIQRLEAKLNPEDQG